MIFVFFLLSSVRSCEAFNNYTPLISVNSTMAVVIDKGFFGNKEDHRQAMGIISSLIDKVVKKEMHIGSITIHVFRDLNVQLHYEYIALLSVATCYQTWYFHEIAKKEKLIHLAVTEPDCPRFPDREGISVPMIVPGEELPQIFLDLRRVDALPWNVINVLHDDTFDRDMIARVMRAVSDELPNKGVNLVSRTLFTLKHTITGHSRKQYIRDILDGFHVEQLGHRFLVIGTEYMIGDVMEVARSLDMVHPKSQWLYIVTDTGTENATNITNFVDLLAEGGNVAFMYNVSDISGACHMNLFNYIEDMLKALSRAVEHALKKEIELVKRVTEEEFNIVRLTKSERQREILHNTKVNFFPDIVRSDGFDGSCLYWRFSSAITWGTYFLHNRAMAHLIDSGIWSPKHGLNLTDVIFPHVSHGFRGITLPIATYHNPPWQVVTSSLPGKKCCDGLMFDVVKYLGQKLNFTYNVIISEPDKHLASSGGNKSSKNTLGMSTVATREIPEDLIKLVEGKKVFLGACGYTVNDYGKSRINFTIPIFLQTYSFLTSRPQQLSRVLLFASPFAKETWACLAASIIIMGPILYLVHKYSPYSTKTSGLNSSWQCVWYVYGALLQQGGMYLPQSDSARLLIGMWWLVVMILVATYSGSLVAFLTFPKMDALILTVEDLIARKDQLSWGFNNGSFLEDYLQNAEEEKYQVLLSRAERHNETVAEEVIERVRKGKHVLIDWRTSLRFLMRNDLTLTGGCHFSLSADEFLAEPIAMIVPKNSPYLAMINGELHRMHESGLTNKWITERMPLKDKCWEMQSSNQAVNERKVNVADMQGIFFVLFMGITLSLFLLCFEFYWHRRKVIKERKLIHPFVY